MIQPVYSIPGNIRRKLAAYQKAFDALKEMEWYYSPIFSRDPEVQELLQLLDGKIVQLKQQLEDHYKELAECNPSEHTEPDKEDAIDLAIYEDAMAEYRKNPVSRPITELWSELGLDSKPEMAAKEVVCSLEDALYQQVSGLCESLGTTPETLCAKFLRWLVEQPDEARAWLQAAQEE